jgi:hypothetical protein
MGSIHKKEEFSLITLCRGVATFSDNGLQISTTHIKYSDICAAELTTRYAFMFPNNKLSLVTKDKMITLGPIRRKDIGKIPFEYAHIKIKSFWDNEFMLVSLAVFIAFKFL